MRLIFKLIHCQVDISQENYGAFGSVHPRPPTMKKVRAILWPCVNKMEKSQETFSRIHTFLTFALWITFQFHQKLKPKDYFFGHNLNSNSCRKNSTCKFMCKHDIPNHLHINIYFTENKHKYMVLFLGNKRDCGFTFTSCKCALGKFPANFMDNTNRSVSNSGVL